MYYTINRTTECDGARTNPAGPHNIQCAPTPDAAHARLPRSPDSFTDSLTPHMHAHHRTHPPARARASSRAPRVVGVPLRRQALAANLLEW